MKERAASSRVDVRPVTVDPTAKIALHVLRASTRIQPDQTSVKHAQQVGNLQGRLDHEL